MARATAVKIATKVVRVSSRFPRKRRFRKSRVEKPGTAAEAEVEPTRNSPTVRTRPERERSGSRGLNMKKTDGNHGSTMVQH